MTVMASSAPAGPLASPRHLPRNPEHPPASLGRPAGAQSSSTGQPPPSVGAMAAASTGHRQLEQPSLAPSPPGVPSAVIMSRPAVAAARVPAPAAGTKRKAADFPPASSMSAKAPKVRGMAAANAEEEEDSQEPECSQIGGDILSEGRYCEYPPITPQLQPQAPIQPWPNQP